MGHLGSFSGLFLCYGIEGCYLVVWSSSTYIVCSLVLGWTYVRTMNIVRNNPSQNSGSPNEHRWVCVKGGEKRGVIFGPAFPPTHSFKTAAMWRCYDIVPLDYTLLLRRSPPYKKIRRTKSWQHNPFTLKPWVHDFKNHLGRFTKSLCAS